MLALALPKLFEFEMYKCFVHRMGNPFIYPTLDWNFPGQSAIMVVIAAVSLIVVYIVVVAIGALRDFLSRNFAVRETLSISTETY